MIKEALKYIVSLNAPYTREIETNGKKNFYSDKPLHRVAYFPRANKVLEMSTLTSLVDYIRNNVDTMPGKMIVQVSSPTRVKLISSLDEERVREELVDVNVVTPKFSFNEFIAKEEFVIGVQSKIIDEFDRDVILKVAGTVEAGTIAEYGDDGVSQKATVRQGITSKAEGIIPNPVKLKPYRSFLEIDQPESDFVFRLKQDKYDGILCALFEADGGAWKINAMQNIKNYLQNELADFEQFTIIS